jgi:hypothetical protein
MSLFFCLYCYFVVWQLTSSLRHRDEECRSRVSSPAEEVFEPGARHTNALVAAALEYFS